MPFLKTYSLYYFSVPILPGKFYMVLRKINDDMLALLCYMSLYKSTIGGKGRIYIIIVVDIPKCHNLYIHQYLKIFLFYFLPNSIPYNLLFFFLKGRVKVSYTLNSIPPILKIISLLNTLSFLILKKFFIERNIQAL